MKFEGIYTPAITPLAADGSIDQGGVRRGARFPGRSRKSTASSSVARPASTTPRPRKSVSNWPPTPRTCHRHALPLIIGTGAIRTEDSVAFAKHAKEIGADAILVGTAAVRAADRAGESPSTR